uniref:Receptor-like protein 15 n=1 Tax=Elaeis guineensis var. tenera TaxID=51953 RepID=A0A6I9QN38_ELAGV
LNRLQNLRELDLSYNQFDGNFSFSSFGNLSKLEYIDLSNNEKLFIHLDSGKFVPSLQLRFLILSHCNLDVNSLATPAFLASQFKLEALDLSHNNLTGNFPIWLFENLTRLTYLNLRNNSIEGAFQFPNHLNATMLLLDLFMNFLSGSIPTNIGTIFPHMAALYLSSNHLTGNIPSSLGNMSNLRHLDLSNNLLSGEVPNALMIDCPNLSFLNLSNNNLHGKVYGTNRGHVSLEVVDLHRNKFSGTLPSNLSGYQQLRVLDVHNNQLSGLAPESEGLVSDLLILNLAGNHFHGQIPHHLCNLSMLEALDLSNNSFSGSLPHCLQSSNLALLKISGNDLTGTIPTGYFNISSLASLDLSNNQLSGKLPSQIRDQMPLGILVLRGNSLEGSIPMVLCKLSSLHVLDLSRNNLSGSIPSCFSKMNFRIFNLTDEHLPLDGFILEFNIFLGTYLTTTGSVSHLDELAMGILPDVNIDLVTKGTLYTYTNDKLLPSTIDLSENKLTGNIPSEIGNLDELVQLNLSHNQLTGPIPETLSKLRQIESLDISHNQLSGMIPWQLTQLTFLEFFSVAYNNLSGCTPDLKYQFATFNMSSYEGNIGLHGPPLENTRTSDSNPTVKVEENQDDSGVDDVIFFEIVAASFVVGFYGCIAFLLFHPIGQHIRSILDGYVDSLTERFLMAAQKQTCMQPNRK